MARKKKVSPDAVPKPSPKAVVVSGVSAAPPHLPPPERDPSPDKGDNLRTLNHLLIKETVERREQVSQLQSRIDNLAEEQSITSLLERDVTRIVVAAGLAEFSAKDAERKERDQQSAAAQKAAVEERVKAMDLSLRAVGEKLEAVKVEKEGIQRTLSLALSERDSALFDLAQIKRELEAREETSKKEQEQLKENLRQRKIDMETLEAKKEEQMRSLEEALRSTNEKLTLADRDKSEMKITLDRAISEKTANRNELDFMENFSRELQKQLKIIREQADDLTKQKEAMGKELEDKIAKVAEEKSSFERKAATIECEKVELEEERNKLRLELKTSEAKVKELHLILAQKTSSDAQLRHENDVLKRTNEKLEQIKRELEAWEETSKKEQEQLIENMTQRKIDSETLEAEKLAIKEQLRSLEEALRSTNEKLMLVDHDKSEMKITLDRAILEKTANQKELEMTKNLSLELQNQLKTISEEADNLNKLKEAMGKELKDKIAKVVQEKFSLERMIEISKSEKVDLEEVKNKLRLEMKAVEQVSQEKYELEKALKQTILEMQSKQVELDEKEKVNKEILEDLVKLQKESDSLLKQKERLEEELEAQKEEFEKELDRVKNYTKKIEQEKDVFEGLRANQESVIADLKSELLQLQLHLSEIQELSRVSNEQNARLKINLDSAESNLLLQKEEARGLRMQIKELEECMDDVEEKLQNVKAELDSLLIDSKEKSKQYDSLSKEKALLEEKLVDTQNMFKDMEEQSKTSKVNIEKVLNLLRSTSDAIIGEVDYKENELAEKLKDKELQFEIRQFEKIFDDIKLAFKSRMEKNADMTRELQHLQGALVEANKKKGGIWIWLYPAATTIVAAVSMAYVAKGR